MAEKKKDNPHPSANPYVPRSFCNERFSRVSDKLDVIDEKITDLKDDLKENKIPHLSGRDQALVYVSLITGFTGIIIALIQATA